MGEQSKLKPGVAAGISQGGKGRSGGTEREKSAKGSPLVWRQLRGSWGTPPNDGVDNLLSCLEGTDRTISLDLGLSIATEFALYGGGGGGSVE
jgi:hypothetical protein